MIDSHVHLPSPGWAGHESYFSSVASAIDYLRAVGTTKAVFNTWQGVLGKTEDDINAANEAALKLTDECGGFLYPGAVIHPEFPACSLRWLETFRKMGYVWVGELVHYTHSHRYIDPPFLKLFEACADQGFIVQLHCHEDVISLAQRFPQGRFVMSHLTGDESLRQIAQCENLWQDISGMQAGLVMGGLQRAVDILGTERMLYGTDFDGYEPYPFIAGVNRIVSDPAARAAIFDGNIQRLLLEN